MPHFLCPLKEAAETCPQNAAIVWQNTTITYAELNKFVEEAQKKVRGKSLVICHPLDYRLIIVLFAAFREKAPVFIGNTRLPFLEILKKGKELGCSLVLAGEQEKAANPSILTLEDFFFLPDAPSFSEPYLEDESSAVFLMTSGSTSEPKIAKLSLGNLYYNAKGSLKCLSLQERDSWLFSLPLFHVAGLGIVFRCFLAKAAIKMPDSSLSLASNLAYHKPSHISVVPTQLMRLLQEPLLLDFSKNLKCLLLGGGPISANLYDEGKAKNLPLFLTYGLTEMASSVVISDNPGRKGDLFFLGHPLPYRKVKVDDNQEIFVGGQTLFKGYLSQKTEEWFATRDLGIYDNHLGLAILGRKDRMFISGGENIQPEEIERILLQFPGIYEAIVVPKKHPEFGFVPFAFARFGKKKVDTQKIFESLREKLPKYKLPVRILDLDTLPQDTLKPNLKLLTEVANDPKM